MLSQTQPAKPSLSTSPRFIRRFQTCAYPKLNRRLPLASSGDFKPTLTPNSIGDFPSHDPAIPTQQGCLLKYVVWEHVRASLFSDSPESVAFALKRISTWRSRSCLPVTIEVTASIIKIQQKDPAFSTGSGREVSEEEEQEMRLLKGVSMAGGVMEVDMAYLTSRFERVVGSLEDSEAMYMINHVDVTSLCAM